MCQPCSRCRDARSWVTTVNNVAAIPAFTYTCIQKYHSLKASKILSFHLNKKTSGKGRDSQVWKSLCHCKYIEDMIHKCTAQKKVLRFSENKKQLKATTKIFF